MTIVLPSLQLPGALSGAPFLFTEPVRYVTAPSLQGGDPDSVRLPRLTAPSGHGSVTVPSRDHRECKRRDKPACSRG
jgi:hypothetical protein